MSGFAYVRIPQHINDDAVEMSSSVMSLRDADAPPCKPSLLEKTHTVGPTSLSSVTTPVRVKNMSKLPELLWRRAVLRGESIHPPGIYWLVCLLAEDEKQEARRKTAAIRLAKLEQDMWRDCFGIDAQSPQYPKTFSARTKWLKRHVPELMDQLEVRIVSEAVQELI